MVNRKEGRHALQRMGSSSAGSSNSLQHGAGRHHSSTTRRRRGAFQNEWGLGDDGAVLKDVLYPEATGKGILKIKSLEDSLQSCKDETATTTTRPRISKRLSSAFIALSGSFRVALGQNIADDEQQATKRAERKEQQGEDTEETAVEQTIEEYCSKKVKFSDLDMREYEMELDDNPSVAKGPAVGLSWKFEEIGKISVDIYEKNRPPRRKMKDIKMGVKARQSILRAAGASDAEIEEFSKSIKVARKQRNKTVKRLRHARNQEKREDFWNKLKRTFFLKPSEEAAVDALWDNAQVVSSQKKRASAS